MFYQYSIPLSMKQIRIQGVKYDFFHGQGTDVDDDVLLLPGVREMLAQEDVVPFGQSEYDREATERAMTRIQETKKVEGSPILEDGQQDQETEDPDFISVDLADPISSVLSAAQPASKTRRKRR